MADPQSPQYSQARGQLTVIVNPGAIEEHQNLRHGLLHGPYVRLHA